MQISEFLKNYRKKNLLTLQEMADRAGLSLTGYYMIEKGQKQPKGKTIAKLCKAVKLSRTKLLEELCK